MWRKAQRPAKMPALARKGPSAIAKARPMVGIVGDICPRHHLIAYTAKMEHHLRFHVHDAEFTQMRVAETHCIKTNSLEDFRGRHDLRSSHSVILGRH